MKLFRSLARAFLALVAGGKGSHLNCICIRRALNVCTYFQRVCTAGALAGETRRRLFPPALVSASELLFFSALILKSNSSRLLYEIRSRQQKTPAQWRANEMHIPGKKALALKRERGH